MSNLAKNSVNRSVFLTPFLLLFLLLVLMLTGCASTASNVGQVERITPEQLAKILPAPIATLPLAEIVADSKQAISADKIIAKIKISNSRYALTPSQVLDLNLQGVDIKVLDYIQQSNELAQQNAIADELNKREKEKRAAQIQLRNERNFNRYQFYDPFWGSGFGGFYGRGFGPGWIGPIGPGGRYWGNRFGWGLGYGYPFGW